MIQEIYQKQFSVVKILSESWKRFTESFRLILIITLIIYIPINIALFFIPIENSLEGFRLYYRIIQILEGFIGIIATMAIAYAIKNRIDGKSISVGDALKKSLSRWGAVIGTKIILGIFLLGLTLLLIVPGIIYSVYWIFVVYVVILNNKSGKDALDYSKSIVKGRWWTVAGYSFIFVILSIITGIILGIPSWFLSENIFTSVAMGILVDISFSFFTVVSIIFYINFDSTKQENITEQGAISLEIKDTVS